MNANRQMILVKKSNEILKAFEVTTKHDEKRYNNALNLIRINIERIKHNEPIDSGLYGKVKELLSHNAKSTITRVRPQGKSDSFILVDGKHKPLEVKTNGGRIEALFKMNSRSRSTNYIRYTLDFTVKAGKPRKDGTCKPAEHRYFDGVMLISEFMNIIESTKAYKTICHNSSDIERAIQCDSKKLYNALLNSNHVPYKADFDYMTEDFI